MIHPAQGTPKQTRSFLNVFFKRRTGRCQTQRRRRLGPAHTVANMDVIQEAAMVDMFNLRLI